MNGELIKFDVVKLHPFKPFLLRLWYEIKERKSRVFLVDEEARKLQSILSDVDKDIHQLEHIKSVVEQLLLHSGNKSEA